MKVQRVSSQSTLEPVIGFSRAVRVGDQIYVAGTAATGPKGEVMYPNDIHGQTQYCIEIIAAALKSLGADLSHIVRTRIIVKHGQDWEQAASVHQEYFKDIKPVTTVFTVPSFIDEGWLVEIEAEAAL